MNTRERIEIAEQRIKELQLLIHHWKKHAEQIRKARTMS
mgnify:CR=1 FL=1